MQMLLLIVIAGVGLCHSRLSFAQDIRTDLLIDKNLQDKGQALIIVFRNGLPAENVILQTPVGEIKTDSSGVIGFTALAKKHILRIPDTNQNIEFHLIKNQETQITIHLLEEKINTDILTPKESPELQKASGPKQKVSFKINSNKGQTVDGATVLVSGIESIFKTDAKGTVELEVPEGQYSISIFHPNYQTHTLSEVTVGTEPLVLNAITLKESVNELEDVVVLAPKVRGSVSALVEVRKQSSAVTDVLGSEQMSRAGDGDAAASLRRVTGLTLVGGKYVYVRGLGERYSGVQMNQFSLPSPEPSRRVVPLDLFPTAIMESIVVQKSYTPDISGEFGGGVIQLKTKSLPEDYFFKANVAMNYENTNNSLTYKGGSTDWLGIDDGGRDLPSSIRNLLAQGKKLTPQLLPSGEGVSQQELINLGASLSNNYNTTRESIQSMPGLALSMGDGWNLSGIKVGVSGSTLYGQSAEQQERLVKTFNAGSAGKLDRDTSQNTSYTEIETRLAGSLDLGLSLYKHTTLRASTFILRNTTNLAQNNFRENFANGRFTDNTVLDFTERQLLTNHLKGEHKLEKWVNHPVVIDWRAGASQASRDSKDRREYTYDIAEDLKTIASDSSGNRRTWSYLDDESNEISLNLSTPIIKNDPEFIKLKMGVLTVNKDRRSDINRFFFANNYSGSAPFSLSENPEVIYGPDNIKNGNLLLNNLTNDADSYSGAQTINAQYFMVDFSPWEKWSFQAGIRNERSSQDVRTFKYFDPSNPFAISQLNMKDILPAYSVVWKPTDKIRSRLAYSETLARPDFRELSTVGFIDDETGNIVVGNSELQGTVIKNIDHRWEYYFTPDEYASIGVFYKQFEKPIEVTFEAGVNRIQTFENAKEANNFGLELEGRVGMRHFSRDFRRWTVLSNLTLIRSEIALDEKSVGIQTSSSRPLQGQSPYVVNMQLQYDREKVGFSGTLLYNIVGKRITEVGTNDIPDTYEQAFGQLDLVLNQRIKENWSISFRARNLLDPNMDSTQGDEIVRQQRRGRIFGLNLGVVL